jgi:hypothetical protein
MRIDECIFQIPMTSITILNQCFLPFRVFYDIFFKQDYINTTRSTKKAGLFHMRDAAFPRKSTQIKKSARQFRRTIN